LHTAFFDAFSFVNNRGPKIATRTIFADFDGAAQKKRGERERERGREREREGGREERVRNQQTKSYRVKAGDSFLSSTGRQDSLPIEGGRSVCT
jgi:hypothetical protein